MENKFKKDWMSLFNVDKGEPHKIELIDDRVTNFKEDMESNNTQKNSSSKKQNQHTNKTGRIIFKTITLCFSVYFVIAFIVDLINLLNSIWISFADVAKLIFSGIAAIALAIPLLVRYNRIFKWVWAFIAPYLVYTVFNQEYGNSFIVSLTAVVLLFVVSRIVKYDDIEGSVYSQSRIKNKIKKQEKLLHKKQFALTVLSTMKDRVKLRHEMSVIEENLAYLKGLLINIEPKMKKDCEKSKTHYLAKLVYKNILYSIGVLITLVFLYLFALNGRYMKVSDYGILDKWTGVVKVIPSKEMPILKDGERIIKHKHQ